MGVGSPSTSSAPQREDIRDRLPVQLIKSQVIPPAPSRSQCGLEPIADFLLEYFGYSWIAYGASSAVVISHFPNPSSEAESKIGPIFRQVIDVSGDPDVHVSSVSWSPATPSDGGLAVASGDSIFLLSCTVDETSSSSFYWAQIAILVQSTRVEALQWTGSGDGIISGGVEVVLWRRGEYWEKAWSFKPDVPQALVSACWSANELLAAAPSKCEVQIEGSYSTPSKERNSVLVFKGNIHPEHPQAELHHPMPVTMIQFRPSSGRTSFRNARQALRPVLLTCCIDGSARLWGEVDDGKILKSGNDNADHESRKLSICTISVIEVNQTLNGFLGSDLFIRWATDVEGVARNAGKDSLCSFLYHSSEDTTRMCEWVIGLGPNGTVTLWAIHCLDDSSPSRSPRVTLWKKLNLVGFETEAIRLLFSKVMIMRNRVSGPPLSCALVQLASCDVFAWSQLCCQASSDLEHTPTDECPAESALLAGASGVLDVAGHSGKILQVEIHPYIEVELAASLDENGTVFLWSFSSFFNNSIGLPASTPFWKACGKFSVSDNSKKYKCLSWAPAVLDKERFLLMGHETGIDCLLFESVKNDDGKFGVHNLFSIPCRIEDQGKGLSRVCSIPLPSNCLGDFSGRFLVVAIWMDDFLALSWEVIIHHSNLEVNSCSRHMQEIECKFSGKNFSIAIHPRSSSFPAPHNDDKIMSCAVVCPSDLIPSVGQKLHSSDESGSSCYAYHMATGCNDGNIKLWRSIPAQSTSSSTDWALVGMLTSDHGPVLAISPSPFCQKIASLSVTSHPISSTTVSVWECIVVQSASHFIQEEKLCFDGDVVAVKWLKLGNGQVLLGICLQNEFLVYISRKRHGLGVLKCQKPPDENSWVCISANNALPAVSDFLWGPKGSVMFLHHGNLILFSHFTLLADSDVFNRHMLSSSRASPIHVLEGKHQSKFSLKVNRESDLKSVIDAESFSWGCDAVTRICYWSLSQISEKVAGCLPLFHPDALLLNLYLGNWKRALIALRHLAGNFACSGENKRGHISRNMLIPVSLSNYLEGLLSFSSSRKWHLPSSEVAMSLFTPFVGHEVPSAPHASSLSRSEFDDFRMAFEQLYVYNHIDRVEKMEAVAVIDILEEVSNPDSSSAYGSLDEFGRRFWVAVRFQKLCLAHKSNGLPQAEELVVSSALISWAFHSDCHDILFNSLLAKEPSWEEMRNIGFGFWYTNVSELRVKIEGLARQRYIKSKDPKDCALLYIALNRVQVLSGLFKISKDDRDKVLAGFLSRNFQEERNKAAALKNAYVLMGKHQLELAIAFFLLGGDISSAVTVCAKNLGDEQLAIVICRLVEGCSGPSECSLISKFLLPSALSKGDIWMASFLEWVLGNYNQSVLGMLGIQTMSDVYFSKSSCFPSFVDPVIGQYCLMLSLKSSMKNAIGEFKAAGLCSLATSLNASSLAKCGLPLEALECLRSSASLELSTHEMMMRNPNGNFVEAVDADVMKSSANWISDEVSSHIMLSKKLCFIVQYITQLLRIHPGFMDAHFSISEDFRDHELYCHDYEKSLEEFESNFTAAITLARNKFGVVPQGIFEMVILHSYQNGIEFIGHYMLQELVENVLSEENRTRLTNLSSQPFNLQLRAIEEFSCLFANYVSVSCMNCSDSRYAAIDSIAIGEKSRWSASWGFSNQGIAGALWYLKAMLQLFFRRYQKDIVTFFNALDLFLHHMLFVSAWLLRNFKALLVTIRPLLVAFTQGSLEEIQLKDLIELNSQVIIILTQDSRDSRLEIQVHSSSQQPEKIGVSANRMIWPITHSSFWAHMSDFLTSQVDRFSGANYGSGSSSVLPSSKHDSNEMQTLLVSISNFLFDFLKMNSANISFYCSKLFAAYMLRTINASDRAILFLLEDFLAHPAASANHKMSKNTELIDSAGNFFSCELLWHIFIDPKIIHGAPFEQRHIWLPLLQMRSSTQWSDFYLIISEKFDDGNSDKEDKPGSPGYSGGSPMACLTPDDHPFKSSGNKDSFDLKKVLPFKSPIELHRRNGELLEALCVNSIDQHQAAVSSNRKGIVFFNWDDGIFHADKSHYSWGEAEWPDNGWAGSESAPIPKYVSPGVDLGSKSGTHAGLGGATIGAGALVRSGRYLTGGGPFGIPGYAGVGASHFGWGIREGFHPFIEPAAALENIRTRAFASHPSRPFFLAGSSNTHVYLWEFGKDKATSTYGVLPAANFPPSYTTAPVAAVKFDHYGQRFVSAALDGTICTWQLEAGDRSNVHPAGSSLCFSDHSSDVTYVTTSGSIVAAAGYSTSGLNVVVWDTLAPPAMSQASIMCHEGGARSLAVFDNDMGSGSISPLILTGGESGDVGLHDFRYIATGKIKKRIHNDASQHHSMNLSSSKTGDQNRNGMLWYIPNAHSASVTKIATIPSTSLFLTGSKDGDVKLWDAMKARLVYHWPKLHQRHLFFHSSSPRVYGGFLGGIFGGIVKAGVTDIQVSSHGFLSCGGDGLVKFVKLQDLRPTDQLLSNQMFASISGLHGSYFG